MSHSPPRPLPKRRIHGARQQPLHGSKGPLVFQHLLGDAVVALLAVQDDVGEDGLEVAQGELLFVVGSRLRGERFVFQELPLDGRDIAHHVGLAQIPREGVIHLLNDFGELALFVRIALAGAGFAHRLEGRGPPAFEVELLLLEALQAVARQSHVAINLDEICGTRGHCKRRNPKYVV